MKKGFLMGHFAVFFCTLAALAPMTAQAGKAAPSEDGAAPTTARVFDEISFPAFLEALKPPHLDATMGITTLKVRELRDPPELEESLPAVLQAPDFISDLKVVGEGAGPDVCFCLRRIDDVELDPKLSSQRDAFKEFFGDEACRNFVSLAFCGLSRPKIKSIVGAVGKVGRLLVDDYAWDAEEPFSFESVRALIHDIAPVPIFCIRGDIACDEGEACSFRLVRTFSDEPITIFEVGAPLGANFIGEDLPPELDGLLVRRDKLSIQVKGF